MNTPSKKEPVMMSLRVPSDVRIFAIREAAAESEKSDRSVTMADVLRDLLREGMNARQAKAQAQ